MIRGECQVCGRAFKVDDRYAGMTGRCKNCGGAIHIPGQPDDGLDGLPTITAAPTETRKPAPLQPQPPAPAPQPASEEHAPKAPRRDEHDEEPQPSQQAPDDLRPHDARARYEPSEGPTAFSGPWVKEEPRPEPRPEPAPQPQAEPARERSPRADDILVSSKLVTDVGPPPAARRPVVVVIGCIVLCLVGAAFFLRFVAELGWGTAAAGIGVVLALMSVLRLWTGYWDGVVSALLFCVCVLGSAFVKAAPEIARTTRLAFLGAGGLALFLILLMLLLPSSRRFFSRE